MPSTPLIGPPSALQNPSDGSGGTGAGMGASPQTCPIRLERLQKTQSHIVSIGVAATVLINLPERVVENSMIHWVWRSVLKFEGRPSKLRD